MSNYNKGRDYELHVAKLIRQKVGKNTKRNPGSHANWHRRSDIYTELPIHVEAKHQEHVRIKEWMEQAEAAKSFNQTAVVAFRIEEQDYACLNIDDLLNLFIQIADLEAELEDLRQPIPDSSNEEDNKPPVKKPVSKNNKAEAEQLAAQAVERKVEHRGNLGTCKNGHLISSGGRCLWKDCKYSRTYKKPKAKKER